MTDLVLIDWNSVHPMMRQLNEYRHFRPLYERSHRRRHPVSLADDKILSLETIRKVFLSEALEVLDDPRQSFYVGLENRRQVWGTLTKAGKVGFARVEAFPLVYTPHGGKKTGILIAVLKRVWTANRSYDRTQKSYWLDAIEITPSDLTVLDTPI